VRPPQVFFPSDRFRPVRQAFRLPQTLRQMLS
jgi:hypothetical protein